MMEVKNLPLEAAHIRASDRGYKFEGYASVFNGLDSYGDTIVKGAYADTLKNRERPIQLRWNHYGPVIGKWEKAYEDDHGLYMEGELTKGHSTAEDAYALLKHGAVDGLSIGFTIPEGGAKTEEGVRYLEKINLVEVSVVESPADLSATVSDVRSAFEACQSLAEFEAVLRDAGGFSRSESKVLLARLRSLVETPKAQPSVTLALSDLFKKHSLKTAL